MASRVYYESKAMGIKHKLSDWIGLEMGEILLT